MQLLKRLAGGALALSFIAGAAATAPALAQTVTVLVNGQAMTFDQPPVMRNNRVFVPMRAIFERLGSSVVYSNPNINSQGNGRSVHLSIGSTTATVNGSPITMDVAPFVVAGRTEVPLRFVAQALGASVDWNANNSTVSIRTNGGGNESYNGAFTLSNRKPTGRIATTHPAIHANFSEPVNRDSLRVTIDGRDVTSLVYANSNGFDVTPNFELYAGQHRVRVTGTTQAGASFDQSWNFRTSAGGSANLITNISPAPGARVGGNFTLRGTTVPGSSVHIVATGTTGALGGLFQIGTGTFQTDVTADGSGRFYAPISVNTTNGGQVRVLITSTAPNGASLERQVVFSS